MLYNSVGLISKPFDIYNLRTLVSENKSLLIIRLRYVNSSSYKTPYLQLCQKLFSGMDIEYKEIPQFNLYSFPLLNTLVLRGEKKLGMSIASYGSDFRRTDNRMGSFKTNLLFCIYGLLRIINRVLVRLIIGSMGMNFKTVYTDPFPYKLSILSLFSFNQLIFYDGGQSVKTFNLLDSYSKGLQFFLENLSNSKYKGLINKFDIDLLSKVDNKFYTRYLDELQLNSCNNIFDLLSVNNEYLKGSIVYNHTDFILVLGPNFHHSITIDCLVKIKEFYNNVEIYYRPHPREIVANTLQKFCDYNNITISYSVYGIELDILLGLVPFPSNILHFNSSSYKTLLSYDNIKIVNYYDVV